MTANMLRFENMARMEIDSGKTILYSVTPIYAGPRTVPVGYEMSASDLPSEFVPNSIYSVKLGVWKNMGLVTMNGSPVPVGSTP
jgi:hypothetical protein